MRRSRGRRIYRTPDGAQRSRRDGVPKRGLRHRWVRRRSVVEIFDGQRWRRGPDLPFEIDHAMAAAVAEPIDGAGVYVFGGTTPALRRNAASGSRPARQHGARSPRCPDRGRRQPRSRRDGSSTSSADLTYRSWAPTYGTKRTPIAGVKSRRYRRSAITSRRRWSPEASARSVDASSRSRRISRRSSATTRAPIVGRRRPTLRRRAAVSAPRRSATTRVRRRRAARRHVQGGRAVRRGIGTLDARTRPPDAASRYRCRRGTDAPCSHERRPDARWKPDPCIVGLDFP